MNRPDHKLWKQTSQSHFHRWAEHYDRGIINILLFNPSYRRVLSQLRSWQRRGVKNMRMLDIGCGTGSLAVHCFWPGSPLDCIVGLDLSENMLRKAGEKINLLKLADKVSLTLGDAEHLPFSDNSFDLITCCNSFHHYPHQQRALNEMHRVLRKNGRLILIDGCRDDPWGFFIFEICVSHVERHVHHCTRQNFFQLLTNAGFIDISQRVFGVCPPAIINVAVADK